MGDNHETFWCHECDMSVSVVPCPWSETQLCPHCFSDLLELMTTVDSSSASSHHSDHQPPGDNYLLDSPFLQRLIHHLSTHPVNHDDLLPSPTTAATAVPPWSLPASKASVDAIPTVKITSSMLDLDPLVLCAVCKEHFVESVEAKQLPCKHLYHPQCILPWLSSHSSCPLCRFQLPTHNTPDDNQDNHYDWFMEYIAAAAAAATTATRMPNQPEMAPAASSSPNLNANAESSLNGSL